MKEYSKGYETKIAKRKKNSKLAVIIIILTIISVIFIFGMVKFFESVDNSLETRAKLNCADYFLDGINEDLKSIQLCESEECKNYFKENIGFNMEMFGECLK